MRDAVRRDDGFTLVELLVATLLGTIVLFAAFGLVDLAVSSQAETENRLDAAQRGRQGMSQVTRSLRSTLCPQTGVAAIDVAEPQRLRFYASRVSDQNGSIELHKRQLTYETVAGRPRGRVVERVYRNKGTPSQPLWNDTAPNDAPDTTRIVVDNVTPVDAATPVFRYARYDPSVAAGSPARLLPLTPPLAPDDLAVVVQVRVAFDAWPVGARNAGKVHTALDSRIHVRTADPTDPTRRQTCQ